MMPVDKLLNVFNDLKWATNTHMTPYTLTFKAYITISMVLEDLFLHLHFLPVHPYFCPSIFVLPIQMTGGQVSTQSYESQPIKYVNG